MEFHPTSTPLPPTTTNHHQKGLCVNRSERVGVVQTRTPAPRREADLEGGAILAGAALSLIPCHSLSVPLPLSTHPHTHTHMSTHTTPHHTRSRDDEMTPSVSLPHPIGRRGPPHRSFLFLLVRSLASPPPPPSWKKNNNNTDHSNSSSNTETGAGKGGVGGKRVCEWDVWVCPARPIIFPFWEEGCKKGIYQLWTRNPPVIDITM